VWFRKGVNFPIKNDDKHQMTNDGLMIKNAQIDDEGDYLCQASVTSTGEVKRFAINVQVMSIPKWVVEPKDTEGTEGQDVIIKCDAFAKPSPRYQWARNNIPIDGDRFIMTGGTLTIRNVVRQDLGTYTCIAENTSGEIKANVKLFVLIKPEIALMDDVTVVEGNAAVLRCNVREAFPKAQIRWKIAHSNDYIQTSQLDSKYNIVSDSDDESSTSTGKLVGSWSELRFKRADRFDTRVNYTCVASNKAAVTERSTQLFVDYSPKFILNTEAKEVYYSWLITDDLGNSGNAAGQSVRSYPVKLVCVADGHPAPLITWYFNSEPISIDNIKFRLLRDELGYSQLEVNPRSIQDFGDYFCRAENRLDRQEQHIQLRQAVAPRFPPLLKVNGRHPESVKFDIHPSEAVDANGGMPIEAYKIQWRLTNNDWSTPNEQEIPIDMTSLETITNPDRDLFNVEINNLLPDTDYWFRAAAQNKPGLGAWSLNEVPVRTMPRQQPSSVKMTSKEDCQASTRCYIEWSVDSTGGSPIREYSIRWRRIFYKDPQAKHIDTARGEGWSASQKTIASKTNFEMTMLSPNSFYEVEVLARNDIGPSAAQPFRVRTLTTSSGGHGVPEHTMYAGKSPSNSLPGYFTSESSSSMFKISNFVSMSFMLFISIFFLI
jgi:hypothetical protein